MSDCVFCKILSGEISSTKIFEDDESAAFLDIAPKAPVHFLVIPKKHIANLMETGPDDAELLGRLLITAQRLLKEQGCESGGGRFVINCKSDGLQSVDHLHIHVFGGSKFGWPPV
jgi:histidine triad (HIT) family protein